MPQLEKHVWGDDGVTMGWRWVIDDRRSVWLGEISSKLFDQLDAEQRAAGGNDMGWFIVIFEQGEQPAVLARALDDQSGRRVCELIMRGLQRDELRPTLERIVSCTNRPNPTDQRWVGIAPGKHREFCEAITDAERIIER